MSLPRSDLPVLTPQAGIWAAELMGTQGRPYNLCWSARYDRTDVTDAAMRAAVGQLTERHASLHARVPSERGVPVQRFDRPPVVTLRRCGDDDPTGAAAHGPLVRELGTKVNNLEEDALTEIHVLSAKDKIRVIFLQHHVISDGITRALLLEELDALLDGGSPAPVDDYEETVRFALELEHEGAAEVERVIDRWATSPPAPIEFPGNAGAVGFASADGSISGLADRLTAAAAATGANAAVFAVLAASAGLAPYLPAEQMAICIAVSTRPTRESRVGGCFVNNIPVVTQPELTPDTGAATRLRAQIREAAQSRHLPLATLMTAARQRGLVLARPDLALVSASNVSGRGDPVAHGFHGTLAGATFRLWYVNGDLVFSLIAPHSLLGDEQADESFARSSAALEQLATAAAI